MSNPEIRVAVLRISSLITIVSALCQDDDPIAAQAYDTLVNSAIERMKTQIITDHEQLTS